MGIIKKITSIFKKKNTSSSSSSSSSSGSSLPQSTIMTPTTGVTGTSSSSSSGGSSGGSDPLTSAYYSNKGSSSGGSSGGSSSSSSNLPQSTLLTPTAGITPDLTKTQTQAEINQAVKTGGLSKAQKLEASKDFSGKVDVFGTTGLLESSKYYVGGSEVGSLKYGTTKVGRNTGREYFTPYEQPVAETKKKSKLTFEKDEDLEEIEFTKEGATIQTKTKEPKYSEKYIDASKYGTTTPVILNLPPDVDKISYRGTSIISPQTISDIDKITINTKPYIESKITYEGKDKNVPVMSFYLVEPGEEVIGNINGADVTTDKVIQVIPKNIGKTTTGATIYTFEPEGYEEITLTTEESINPKEKLTNLKKVTNYIKESDLIKSIANEGEGLKYIEEKLSSGTTKLLGGGNVGKFTGGVVEAVIPTSLLEIGTDVATFGVGAGIGAGVKVIGKTITSAGTKLAEKTGIQAFSSSGKIFKFAETGTGLYLGGKYALNTISELKSLDDYERKGEVVGESIKDIALFGAGYGKGQKIEEVISGKVVTKGRTEIPTENIILEQALKGERYPSAPIEKHMELFQKESQRLIRKLDGYTGEGKFISPKEVQQLPFKSEPMLFSATGNKFWNTELTVKDVGNSEFKGLFGAPGVSPTFLRVGGKSGKFNFKNYLKSLTEPYGKPGVVGIYPDEFIAGTSAKPGTAFVPGARGYPKTEIQAILPIGSKANILSKDIFFEWEGVKVPLDVFKTSGKGINIKSRTLKEISSSYGGLPKSSSSILSISGKTGLDSLINYKSSSDSYLKDFIKSSEFSSIPSSSTSMKKISSSKKQKGTSKSLSENKISEGITSSASLSSSDLSKSIISSKKKSNTTYSYTEPPLRPEKIIKPITPYKYKLKGITKKQSKEIGYNVFIKEPKTKRYVKVTKKPVKLNEAEDTRNYFIDETTSRQGVVRKTKQKANPLMYDIPRGYSKNTDNKFRRFKQRKGTKIPLEQRRVIEKSKFIQDTSGEKKELSIFKLMASREKKKLNKPVWERVA